jgi:hypothetical protein
LPDVINLSGFKIVAKTNLVVEIKIDLVSHEFSS